MEVMSLAFEAVEEDTRVMNPDVLLAPGFRLATHRWFFGDFLDPQSPFRSLHPDLKVIVVFTQDDPSAAFP